MERRKHVVSRGKRVAASGVASFGAVLLALCLAVSSHPMAWLGWATVCFFAPVLILSAFLLHEPRSPSNGESSFIVASQRHVLLGYALVCTGWLIGAWLIIHRRPEAAWLGWTFAYACAAGLMVSLFLYLDRRPQVQIDAEGYFDRSVGRRIPWHEITGAEIQNVRGTDVLVIFLRNPEQILGGGGFWTRLKRGVENWISVEFHHLGMVRLDACQLEQAVDFITVRCSEVEREREYDDLIALATRRSSGVVLPKGLA